MRIAATSMILAGLLAASVSAQELGRIQTPKAEGSVALRGSVGEAPAETSRPRGDLSALVPAPLPVRPIASPVQADGGQCRRSCARDYYFCLSSEDEATCSPVWVKCQARCGG